MVSSQGSERRVAVDRNGVLQLFEQQVVRHGIAKGHALIQLKTQPIAPIPRDRRLILGTENMLAFYLLTGAPRKPRGCYEIKAVLVEQICIEIGRHGDQTRFSSSSPYQAGDGFDVGELGCGFKRGSNNCFVHHPPQRAYVLSETKCVYFTRRKLLFQDMQLVKSA